MKSSARLRWQLVVLTLCLGSVLCDRANAAGRAGTAREQATLTAVLDEASRSFDRRDYEAARRGYTRATQMDPGSIRAWRGLGWSLWQLGQQDQALKVWNDIAKVQPKDTDIMMALAQAYEYRNDHEWALKLYSRVLTLKPRRASAYMARARINFGLERYPPAENDANAALKLEPGSEDAQFMLAQIYNVTGRETQALSAFEKLSRQKADPRYLRPVADAYLRQGRAESAIPLYQRSLKSDPENRGTVLGLARANARLQQFKDAMAPMSAWLERHPDDAQMREELARYATGMGDYRTAQVHLRTLVRDHPDNMDWKLGLARNLQNSDNVAESNDIAKAILSVDANNVGALELMYQNSLQAGSRKDLLPWLKRLAEADPTPKRLNKLGDAYMATGTEYLAADDQKSARVNYKKSVEIFRRASELDSEDPDAVLGMATALRLSGDYPKAIKAAELVIAGHPAIERARRELYESNLALGRYDRAEELVRESLKQDSGNVTIRQELARTHFRQGQRKTAIQEIQAVLAERIQPSVPVLLYHGLSEAATREDAMPLRNFREQMAMLKREGYETISLEQLVAFKKGGAPLPAKPVLITFDDARSDSFRYADPVLEELGFRATMFTPVAEVGSHGAFTAGWNTLRQMHDSGRWDIQCHSYTGHSSIPVEASGRTGAFFANRMWLPAENRLETLAEFVRRLDEDYRRCKEELTKQLPGLKVTGYAYPFGEVGQRNFSNEHEAVEINKSLALKYYKVGFVQDPSSEVTHISSSAVLPRFEVPWHFSAADLLEQLHSSNPYSSTQLALADLYSWDGQYDKANELFEQVASSENIDQAALLTRRGRVLMWQGDLAQARRYLEEAARLQPESRVAQKGLEQLDERTRSRVWVDALSSSDNRDRSSVSIGPSIRTWFTDRLGWTLSYRRKRYEDQNFDTSQLTPPPAANPVNLRTTGDEVETELLYSKDWRTAFAISAGAVRFKDQSSEQLFGELKAMPIGSVSFNFPVGSAADVSLRATRGYVGTAGAILDELGSTGGEARLQLKAGRDTFFDGRYGYQKYDDSNRRVTGQTELAQRLVDSPDIRLGYRFRYDDTAERSPFFYTPDQFMGHDGVLRIAAGKTAPLQLSLEAAFGAGKEHGGTPHHQASALGNLEINVSDWLNFYVNGGFSEAADFRSTQVNGGLVVMF